MKAFDRFIIRPGIHPHYQLPLSARSVGYRRNADYNSSHDRTIDWYAVHIILAGETSYLRPDKTIQVSEGHGIIHPPGTIMKQRVASGKIVERQWFTFQGAQAFAIVAQLDLPVDRPFPLRRLPDDLLDNLGSALDSSAPTSEFESSGAVYQLLLHIAKELSSSRQDSIQSENPLVGKAESIMNRHYQDQDFDVNKLANILGVHRVHLSRVFTAEDGISPSTYLQRTRLRHAFKLLSDKTLSIKEIAARTGFSNPAYFARRVKLMTGLTPIEIRESSF